MATESSQAVYITTPIYYVNGTPHIGHAYTSLACDIAARFQRLEGREVKLLTGTDEHGRKVEEAARLAGQSPKDFVERFSADFRRLADAIDCSFDDFIRTTEHRHHMASQAIWRKLAARGDLYKGMYLGWYALRDEAYYTESELITREDGVKIAPSGAEVEWCEEPSWFFRLSDYQKPLLDFYHRNPDFIRPRARMNEVISFVEDGLKDLSVSRANFKWGIPVPDDNKAHDKAETHVMYVWLDALVNYLTAIGYPDTDNAAFKKFWSGATHVVGKDILRFHGIYWPAFLISAELPPPRQVFVHGWWLNHGQKMSKSLGNVIDPAILIERYGLDAVRYFLMRHLPFGEDGNFTDQAIIQRINNDLANDLGNLAQRVLSMVARSLDGMPGAAGSLQQADQQILDLSNQTLDKLRGEMDQMRFHKALEAIWALIGDANRYVDHMAPWQLRKHDQQRMQQVLYVVLEVLRRIGLMIIPFMPQSASQLLDQLAQPEDKRKFACWGDQIDGTRKLPKPVGLFPRYVQKGTSDANG